MKGTRRKAITTRGYSETHKDAQVLLALLQESCTEAERVAKVTGFHRDQHLARAAKQRLNDYRLHNGLLNCPTAVENPAGGTGFPCNR